MTNLSKQRSFMIIMTILPMYLSKNSSFITNIKYRRDMNVPSLSYKQLYPHLKPFLFSQPHLSKTILNSDYSSKQESDYQPQHLPLMLYQKQKASDFLQRYLPSALNPPLQQTPQPHKYAKLRYDNHRQLPRLLHPEYFEDLTSQKWPDPYQHTKIRRKPLSNGRHLPRLLTNHQQEKIKIPYLQKKEKKFHPLWISNVKVQQPKSFLVKHINARYPFLVILESDLPDTLIQYDGKSAVPTDVYRIGIGSLLSATWVLTSGVCASGSVKKIRYGNIEAPQNATNVFSKVLTGHRHPGFRVYETKTKGIFNDIGLLHVEPVPINEFAPISAVDYITLLGQEVQVAGYGMTKSFLSKSESQYPLKFNKAAIKLCPRDTIFDGPAICTSSLCNSTLKVGYADWGGPLLHAGKVAGLCSGEIMSTIVFCPVTPFLHWIRITMKLQQ